MWPFHTPAVISYRCFIVTKCVSPAVFKIILFKHNWVTTLSFQSHVTSSFTCAFDSPYAISYLWLIGTETLFLMYIKIFAFSYIWVTTLTFWGHVTSSVIWPFDSSLPNILPIRLPLWPSVYLQPFSRYYSSNTIGSRPWPFKVTWRHRSRVHSICHKPFPVSGQLVPNLYLSPVVGGGIVRCSSKAALPKKCFKKRHFPTKITII